MSKIERQIEVKEYDVIDDNNPKLKDIGERARFQSKKSDWDAVIGELQSNVQGKWFTVNYVFDVNRKVNGTNAVSRFRCLNWCKAQVKVKTMKRKTDGFRDYFKLVK